MQNDTSIDHLFVIGNSFLEPVINANLAEGFETDPTHMVDGPRFYATDPVNHHRSHFSEWLFRQDVLSATGERGTARNMREDRYAYEQIFDAIDVGRITHILFGYYPGDKVSDYDYMLNIIQAHCQHEVKSFVGLSWLPHPENTPEYHKEFDQTLDQCEKMLAHTPHTLVPYGEIVMELLHKGVSHQDMFMDDLGHPTMWLCRMGRQFLRHEILGIPVQNTIFFSKIYENLAEKLQGNQQLTSTEKLQGNQ